MKFEDFLNKAKFYNDRNMRFTLSDRDITYNEGQNFQFINRIVIDGTQWELLMIEIPEYLNNFKNLQVLEIRNIEFITEINNIEILKNLKELHIVNCGLKSLKGVEQCTKLEKLVVNYNKIEKILYIKGLKNLKVLNISENKIKKIENMEILEYKKAHVTIHGNPYIEDCKYSLEYFKKKQIDINIKDSFINRWYKNYIKKRDKILKKRDKKTQQRIKKRNAKGLKVKRKIMDSKSTEKFKIQDSELIFNL